MKGVDLVQPATCHGKSSLRGGRRERLENGHVGTQPHPSPLTQNAKAFVEACQQTATEALLARTGARVHPELQGKLGNRIGWS